MSHLSSLEHDDMVAIMLHLRTMLQDDNGALVRDEAENASMQVFREAAKAVERQVLAQWEKKEAVEPTQPHRALGIPQTVGTNMAVIKARFLNRMAACVKEDKTVSGASRILLVRAKRAYDLLADGQRWE
ncbi:unnamed protein product, partial [Polarella glacialis]